jgi:hypothetical protein
MRKILKQFNFFLKLFYMSLLVVWKTLTKTAYGLC